jgi:hypothetical protein
VEYLGDVVLVNLCDFLSSLILFDIFIIQYSVGWTRSTSLGTPPRKANSLSLNASAALPCKHVNCSLTKILDFVSFVYIGIVACVFFFSFFNSLMSASSFLL